MVDEGLPPGVSAGIRAALDGARVLIVQARVSGGPGVPLALELAREGRRVLLVEPDNREEKLARVAAALEPEVVQARVSITAALVDAGAGAERFDAAVIVGGPAIAAELDRVLAWLEPSGRVLLALPYSARPEETPRALVERLAPKVAARSLEAIDGWVLAAATKDPPSPERWAEVASPEVLLELTERVSREALERAEGAEHAIERSRRTLVARTAERARASERSLRAALEQNVRLRETVARTRQSARYRLGAAVLGAARPSLDVLELPSRIWRIYREKTSGEDAPRVEPARTELDRRFADLLGRLRSRRPERLVVLFTGTSIAGIRGNRPYLLTKVLRARGVPVVFGYAGTIEGELPALGDPDLLELPADYLTEKLPELARIDPAGAVRRLFVLSYPIAAVVPAINQLNAGGWATIYDALDDWEEFARANVASWHSRAVERFAIQSSDLTLAVSGPLADKLTAASGREVAVSPNAYDPGFLAGGYAPKKSDVTKIGYFGHLTPAWFDWGALRAIARARPAWSFEIVGHGAPIGVEVPPNVHLLGPKPPREICALAEAWRAAIIPFKMGPLADAVDPIKVYEYLALGLPVVSFRMPQIATYPHVTTVRTVEDFVVALDRALEERFDALVVASFLRENTWAKRLDDMLQRADRVLERRPFEKTLHLGGAA